MADQCHFHIEEMFLQLNINKFEFQFVSLLYMHLSLLITAGFQNWSIVEFNSEHAYIVGDIIQLMQKNASWH